MLQIMPKEGRFFDMFRDLASCIVQAADEFNELLANPSEYERRASLIKDIEHRGDEITHQTVELLHKTFITPLDREDIHQLISKMDDILDFIEAASQRVFLYDLQNVPDEGKELGTLCAQSAKLIQSSVSQLDNLKNPDDLIRQCVEINRLENDADVVLRGAMAKLFREETDVKQLIKLKEIYEMLETVTDRCEDVANIIEGIVLEYA